MPVLSETRYRERAPSGAPETIGGNGRIGLVALATDLNSEADLRRMAPDGVEIFTNRVYNRNPTTVDNLQAMAPDITRAAAGILPGVSIDLLIYACTSGTAVIGESEVMRLLRAGRGDLPCTTPVTATMAALASLEARRISILTPYIESVNRELVEFFHRRNIEVLNIYGFGIENDTDMTGVTHASLYEAALETCDPDADLLFISCTALRSAQVAQKIESQIRKPVVTSNQAMMWHALKLLKRPFQVPGFGRLFDH